MTEHSAAHNTRQGVNAFPLRDFLGHANLAPTQLYVHLSQEDQKKVMEATSL